MNPISRNVTFAIGALCAAALASANDRSVALQTPSAVSSLPTSGSFSQFWWSDFDSNGASDAFVVHPGGDAVLLANHGDGSFEDVTVRAGLAGLTGVRQALWQDVDGDAQPELYVVIPGGKSKLFQYESGLFSEITQTAGLALEAAVLQGEWLDTNGDALPDLHLSTARGELVFQNLGGAQFREIDLGIAATSARWSQDLSEWTQRGDEVPALPPGAPSPQGAGGSQAATTFGGVSSTPGRGQAAASPFCWDSIKDQTTMNCLVASSTPTVGSLYPLGLEFNIDGAGRVGIGTLAPGTSLDVVGSIRASGQLISTAASGAPLVVTSTDQVPNLNADLLDGLHASTFTQLGQTIEGAEIADGTVTGADLANSTVTGGQVADGSLTGADVFDDSLTGSDVMDGSLTSADLALGSVGSAEILDNSVSYNDLNFSNNIVASDLAANSVGASELAGNAVNGGNIIDNAVSSFDILDNTITAVDLAANSVGASEIATNSVGTDELAFGAVHNGDVNTNAAIQGSKIVPDFVAQDVTTTGSGYFGDGTQPFSMRGLGMHNPTRGYLGVQGASNFDGVPSADWFGKRIAVAGISTSSSTSTYGVLGHAASVGVRAENSIVPGNYASLATQYDGVSAYGLIVGVEGHSLSTTGRGLRGNAWATTGVNYGLDAMSRSTAGRGVRGEAIATSGSTYGVEGRTYSPTGFGIISFGSSGTTGQKNFIQPHPSDPSKEIRFTSLEGNESGTYFRGKGHMTNGVAVILVPEEFRLVSESEQITVSLTARGPGANLWVQSSDLDQVVVRGFGDVNFDYVVNGVRKGWANYEAVHANQGFVPEKRGVPFGTQYPTEFRQLLVENGILNPDFTPNETTAFALGWELTDPSEHVFAEETGTPLQVDQAAAQAEAADWEAQE